MKARGIVFLTSILGAAGLFASACGDEGTTDGSGGEGGGAAADEQTLEGELESMTLTSDTKWILKGIVSVPSGVTLTIEPGTKIVGEKASLGTLVVQRGGKLEAAGTAD